MGKRVKQRRRNRSPTRRRHPSSVCGPLESLSFAFRHLCRGTHVRTSGAAGEEAEWPCIPRWATQSKGRELEFRGLRAAELEAWLDHAATVFNTPRTHFANHWHNDPWKDLEGIRVAVDGGRIASTVRVFMRRIHLGGERVAAGGIGEVSTLPEYRRRGLATRLLRDAVGFMRERGIAISSLFGNQGIYRAEGWERVPLYYAWRQMGAKVDRAFRIRPADPGQGSELETLAALYDAYARRFNGTLCATTPGTGGIGSPPSPRAYGWPKRGGPSRPTCLYPGTEARKDWR